jgi:rhodanese-related sulfurtransferase
MSALFRRRATVRPSRIPEVTTTEAAALGEEVAIVVDVREPFEWNAGHAPGARHIPLGRLSRHVSELPRDKRIFLVCRSGNRSAQATAMLTAAGFDAANVTGGMAAWIRAGQPVVTDSGEPGSVA